MVSSNISIHSRTVVIDSYLFIAFTPFDTNIKKGGLLVGRVLEKARRFRQLINPHAELAPHLRLRRRCRRDISGHGRRCEKPHTPPLLRRRSGGGRAPEAPAGMGLGRRGGRGFRRPRRRRGLEAAGEAPGRGVPGGRAVEADREGNREGRQSDPEHQRGHPGHDQDRRCRFREQFLVSVDLDFVDWNCSCMWGWKWNVGDRVGGL